MFAGLRFATLLNAFRSLSSPKSVQTNQLGASKAGVTKAEIQKLFELNRSSNDSRDTLLASEKLQRQSTEMIRGAMYRAD